VFVAGPPPAVGPAAGARLVRLCRRRFTGHSALAADPQLRVYLADMVGPYGLALRDDLLADGVGHSFGEMAEPLLADAVSPAEPVDLLVFAFALHDIRLGRATATYLGHHCQGDPLAFGVCDQGSAGAFTGIRLIQEHFRAGTARRALLLVAEQSALHYRPAGPAPVPDQHTAVCLRFDAADRPADPVLVRPGVRGQRLAGELAATLANTPGTVIVSAELGGLVAPELAADMVVAPAGAPYTGVWWALAEHAQGPVTVVDHDPVLGYLCTFSLAAQADADSMVVRTCSTATLP
jgi:hypothetical protein